MQVTVKYFLGTLFLGSHLSLSCIQVSVINLKINLFKITVL